MTDPDRPVVAIDVGSSAVKAALIDTDGIRGGNDGVVSCPVSTSTPADRWVEQDADEWWDAASRAVRDLQADGRAEAGVIAVTGQMQDLVTLDSTGRPVRPVVLYSDLRAVVEHTELVDELEPSWTVAIGAGPDPTNRLASWRWLERHEPDHADRTASVIFGGGAEIVRRLTGRCLSDHTTAATTGLYDVSRRCWWPPAARLVGDRMPVLDDGRRHRLQDDVATTWGISDDAAVVLAPGDAVATTLGVVATDVDRPYAHLGTSGWVGVAADRRSHDPQVIDLPGLGADHRLHVDPILSAGSMVDWARHTLLGGVSIPELERLAADGFGAGAGIVVVPDLDGRRSGADATAHVLGLTRSSSPAHLAAAVFEGIAHRLRRSIELIAPDAAHLVVCGGGSSSDEWCRIIADVTDRRVSRSDASHASLIGAARAAGVDVATHRDLDVAPRRDRAIAHRAMRPTFDALADRLAETEAELARMR